MDGLQELQQENQKAMINKMIGELTEQCWGKCITGTPGNKFSSQKNQLLFLDTYVHTLSDFCCRRHHRINRS
ncbi:unnamed protein product [Musa acuminata subsp. burmannicoides]